jgi:hypothetical protein
MPQQEVSSDELLKTAMDVIDRFGITEYLGTEETITEEIDGVERKVIGAGIALSDDSGSVWVFRTLEGDYLKVVDSTNNVDQPHLPFLYAEAIESVTVLEVRDGETTEFNLKYAPYSLRELTALSQGKTTQSRKEEALAIEESQNQLPDERSPSESTLEKLASDYVAFLSKPDLEDSDPQPFTLEEQNLILNLNPEDWALAVKSAREESVLDPVKETSEIAAIAPKLSPQELKELAADFVEKSNMSLTLEFQANHLMQASEFYQNMASDVYEKASEAGIDEPDWREAVDLEKIEWGNQTAKEIVSASVKLLNSHESDEFDLNETRIRYDRESQQLTVVDKVKGSTIAAQRNDEGWERISSTFTPAQIMGLKEELEGQLDLDSFQLPAAPDALTQKKVAGAQLSQ